MRGPLLAVLGLGIAACHRDASNATARARAVSEAPPRVSDEAIRAPNAFAVEPPKLPEDPAAGKRASAQWREHLEAEDREREMGYDSRKLPQHKRVMSLLAAAQSIYDGAKTATALERTHGSAEKMLEKARLEIAALDPWGVNSHLLLDYRAIHQALLTTYPAAKRAALQGHVDAFTAAQADLDKRRAAITKWLAEVASSEEGEKAGED